MITVKSRLDLIYEILGIFEDDTELFADCLESLDNYNCILSEDRYFHMAEFDDLFCGCSPSDIAEKIVNTDFNPNDSYFKEGIYGLESENFRDYSEYLNMDTIEQMAENFDDIYIDDDDLIELFQEYLTAME